MLELKDYTKESMQITGNMSSFVYCRWAPSLGELEDTAENVWGTLPYHEEATNYPTVFFGLYGLPDFFALWQHRGKKWILWTGSDIRHFKNGYWLEDKGSIRIEPPQFAKWISRNCESWVENQVEYDALKEMGIESQICPSFLGDVTKFEVSYRWSDRSKLYTSVSGEEFKLYGWDKIPKLARQNPDIEFHLYGSSSYKPAMGIPNVFFHGRVPKEQMNQEIKNMQGALRLTEFEGFSEILAKSILMGQWPVSLIEYPHMLSVKEISEIKKEPNIEGRNYYLKVLNQFPWNQKR